MATNNGPSLRHMFNIPTKGDIRRKTVSKQADDANKADDDEPSIYLCGNSLGLQPTLTQKYMQQYLSTWATKGVFGHFTELSDTDLPPWLHVDDSVQADMASIVGGMTSEVAVMQTLTANLHLMMASFYRPTKERYKIILEGKAFPSDHYAVESQIRHHDLDPQDAMVLIEPDPTTSLISTDHILATIEKHADSTALILLPGIQFYTGQLLDIATITAYAHQRDILIGWDLAHAVGNVPLQLHDWEADFAVWCTYKYLNCGPGSIGGAFVHERNWGKPRLSGWWGNKKASRFAMSNVSEPIEGAGGWALSNPSVADTTAVRASLDVFKQTSMAKLREMSLQLTGRLEQGLDACEAKGLFSIITPRNTAERGAQLSVQLKPGFLEPVFQRLEEAGVVIDERKPDVMAQGGRGEKGWSEIK